jgi:hypothetical protein
MESKLYPCFGFLACIHFVGRRFLLAVSSNFANRWFAFSLATVALLGSKAVHIYAHADAFQTHDLLRWGISFFAQDAILLLLLRLLLDSSAGLITTLPLLRAVSTIISMAIVSTVFLLAWISLSFFAMTSSELQWRNAALAGDSGSWKMVANGAASGVMVLAVLLLVAALLQTVCYSSAGIALDILQGPVIFLLNLLPGKRWTKIVQLQDDGWSDEARLDRKNSADYALIKEHPMDDQQYDQSSSSARPRWQRILVSIILAAPLMCTILRPTDSSLVYLSWTLPLMPIVDLSQSSSALTSLDLGSGNASAILDNRSALTKPVTFPWLPKTESPLQGFEDWYEPGKDHYSARADPLKISNLDDGLLKALQETDLSKVRIRNIMLIKLESTRKDVFPIKKDSAVVEKLESTFQNHSLPDHAWDMLASLSETTRYLTGDNDDGFEEYRAGSGGRRTAQGRPRGSINANNAFTGSTYTFKSLVSTLCGCSALMADFTQEDRKHIYQPCLAQIFDAFNQIDRTGDDHANHAPGDDFTSFPWKSSFMQSVTDRYDRQDTLMPAMGYPKEHQKNIDSWYLRGEPKFGKVEMDDINYYGMPEVAIKDYIQDAFATARETKQRVFLTHITSTTHHPFGMPEGEPYVQLSDDKEWDDLSKYVNSVGYVDRWLKQILDILEAEGVAEETLLILVGDHGLGLAERGTVTAYSQTHVANYHVPLAISHPHLPQINIDDAVTSLQILPTILDLLIETGSLSKSEGRAAKDLIRNYEGQSLLRPLRKHSTETGQRAWQFTVMNPGGSTLAMRDGALPNWRLIVPVFGNYEWRFTDLATDPHEKNPTVAFELYKLKGMVEEAYGEQAVKWIEEAAVVAQWWVSENYKRYRYEP